MNTTIAELFAKYFGDMAFYSDWGQYQLRKDNWYYGKDQIMYIYIVYDDTYIIVMQNYTCHALTPDTIVKRRIN